MHRDITSESNNTDTYLWIKLLISKYFSQLDQGIKNGDLILLFSDELLSEFIEISARPKFKKYFSKSDINDILSTIHNHAEFIQVNSIIELFRDPKDNFLLALALDANANYLITSDKDFLLIKKINKTKIIFVTALLQKIHTKR